MVFLPFLSLFLLLNFHGNLAMEGELPVILMPTSKLQTYIIHVQKPETGVLEQEGDQESWHLSFMPEVDETTSGEMPRILYSYRNVMSGFSARLTEEQVKAMEEKDGFISAMPETILHLHTTHTPGYLGLNKQSGLWKDSNFGKGVIIGVLDSGVTPGHPSFDDKGMPPPPTKWKGRCDFNTSVCNNKLIGARSFTHANRLLVEESPVDENGHGTHTASTAAGAFVKGANVFGNAKGTATGMAPLAHLSIYKVCNRQGRCSDADIIAGLDAAIEDGVDVLSLSLGGDESTPFFKDKTAIGLFKAIQKGIFVSCSAGNDGPSKSTLTNEAPWILTVGASTINRRIVAVAKLGNIEEYEGESLFQPEDYTSPILPLADAGKNGDETSAFCGEELLTNNDVKGKVVVCEVGGGIGNILKGLVVKMVGGAAMILINQQSGGFTTSAEDHVLPTTHVSYAAGLKIKAYIKSSKNPTASILFKGTIIKDSSSNPAMADFSSRGPSLQSPGIIKPDITGPGVNILAAWPFPLDKNTNSASTFDIISGTSMSCPHLSGIAALIKSSHPDWSPAAIKSAIMTSANVTNPQGKPILDQDLQPANLFSMGAGHVNPSRSADPGLVYDIQPDDYIPYLCGLYGEDARVTIIVGKPVFCSLVSKIPEGELNYPSFSVALGPRQTFSRTVTNVGDANSIYSAIVEAPLGVSVTVKPSKISFTEVNQKVRYSVTFRRIGSAKVPGEFAQGYLKWVSDKHVVRSPIAVKFN